MIGILAVFFVLVIAFTVFVLFPIVRVFADSPPASPRMHSGSTTITLPLMSGEIVTDTLALPFAATGFGFQIDGSFPQGSDVYVSLRHVEQNGSLGAWEGGDAIERDKKSDEEEGKIVGPLLTQPAQTVQIKLESVAAPDGIAPTLRSIVVTYFGEPEGEVKAVGGSEYSMHAADFRIISRSEWGADESWRCTKFDRTTNDCAAPADVIWPQEVVPVKKFIIHHTAGSTGGTDPAATVRGIYYYQAVTLGWGDIGYNYLIDPQGNIYEGRKGGDGVVGGHSHYDTCVELGGSSSTCSSADGDATVGYQENSGSVGIALLGEYESRDTVTTAAQGALEWLIGQKATASSINPTSLSNWTVPVTVKSARTLDASTLSSVLDKSASVLRDRKISYTFSSANPLSITVTMQSIPTILGHIDVDRTLCPGKNLYGVLSAISPVLGSTAVADYRAEQVGAPDFPIALFQNYRTSGTLVFRNTGTLPWSKGEFTLTVTDENDTESPFYSSAWPSRFGNITFNESAVPVNGTATFTIPILTPLDPKVYHIKFHLFHQNGDGESEEIAGGQAERFLRVDAKDAATRVYDNWRPALLRGWTPIITFNMRNTGITSWRSTDTVLRLKDVSGGASPFVNSNWNGGKGYGVGILRQSIVHPGEIGTFVIRLRAPRTPDLYRVALHIERSGNPAWIQDSIRMIHLVRVDP